jgi:DNA-binding FadR family transcriptional regulator
MAISRLTLREALKRLEAEGYIGVRRGVQGGAFVSGVPALMGLAARRMARDPSALLRLHELRALIEPGLARLAAARREVPDFKRLDQAMSVIEAARGPADLRQGEAMLRLALDEAAHNPYPVRVARDALHEALPPYATGIDEGASAPIAAELAALSTAIRDRDQPGAEAAMIRILSRERDRPCAALGR